MAPDFKIDWGKVRELITDKTRLILINNPNNPAGSILEKEDFEALSQIVKDTNILILSDEVYEHIVFDGKKHLSVSQIGRASCRERDESEMGPVESNIKRCRTVALEAVKIH